MGSIANEFIKKPQLIQKIGLAFSTENKSDLKVSLCEVSGKITEMFSSLVQEWLRIANEIDLCLDRIHKRISDTEINAELIDSYTKLMDQDLTSMILSEFIDNLRTEILKKCSEIRFSPPQAGKSDSTTEVLPEASRSGANSNSQHLDPDQEKCSRPHSSQQQQERIDPIKSSNHSSSRSSNDSISEPRGGGGDSQSNSDAERHDDESGSGFESSGESSHSSDNDEPSSTSAASKSKPVVQFKQESVTETNDASKSKPVVVKRAHTKGSSSSSSSSVPVPSTSTASLSTPHPYKKNGIRASNSKVIDEITLSSDIEDEALIGENPSTSSSNSKMDAKIHKKKKAHSTKRALGAQQHESYSSKVPVAKNSVPENIFPPVVFRCKLCKMGFPKPVDVKNHKMKAHPKAYNKISKRASSPSTSYSSESPSSSESDSDSSDPPSQKQTTPHDSRKVKIKKNRAKHWDKYTLDKKTGKFKCKFPNCTKEFRQASGAHNHYGIVHLKKTFGCKVCSKKFGSRYTLGLHYRICGGERILGEGAQAQRQQEQQQHPTTGQETEMNQS